MGGKDYPIHYGKNVWNHQPVINIWVFGVFQTSLIQPLCPSGLINVHLVQSTIAKAQLEGVAQGYSEDENTGLRLITKRQVTK